jgi:hypothetical protein
MTLDQAATTDDPTLAGLVPQPSRVRNVVVVGLAVLALVAAAWLGTALRLDLRDRVGGAELMSEGRIAYAASFGGRSFPGVQVTAVHPPAGTRTLAVWVLGPGDPDPLHDATSLTAAVEVMQASGATDVLPQRVPVSGLQVLVLLEVEDCAARSDEDGPSSTEDPMILELRSPLGSGAQFDLDFFAWPRADLEAVGACD